MQVLKSIGKYIYSRLILIIREITGFNPPSVSKMSNGFN